MFWNQNWSSGQRDWMMVGLIVVTQAGLLFGYVYLKPEKRPQKSALQWPNKTVAVQSQKNSPNYQNNPGAVPALPLQKQENNDALLPVKHEVASTPNPSNTGKPNLPVFNPTDIPLPVPPGNNLIPNSTNPNGGNSVTMFPPLPVPKPQTNLLPPTVPDLPSFPNLPKPVGTEFPPVPNLPPPGSPDLKFPLPPISLENPNIPVPSFPPKNDPLNPTIPSIPSNSFPQPPVFNPMSKTNPGGEPQEFPNLNLPVPSFPNSNAPSFPKPGFPGGNPTNTNPIPNSSVGNIPVTDQDVLRALKEAKTVGANKSKFNPNFYPPVEPLQTPLPPPTNEPPLQVPPVPSNGLQLNQSQTTTKRMDPDSIVKQTKPAPSPWKLKLEVISGRTHLTASTDEGVDMLVRCENLNLQRPNGNIEALGKVEIQSAKFSGICDRLTINWQEEQMQMHGNARLKSIQNGQEIELSGTQLQLRLRAVPNSLPGQSTQSRFHSSDVQLSVFEVK